MFGPALSKFIGCDITIRIMSRFRFILFRCGIAFPVFILLGVASFAQSAPCTHRTIFTSVADRNFAPIQGLQPSDFVGEFRGKPVRILSVGPNGQRQRIVILLDASGSVSSDREVWRLALGIASSLADSQLKDTDLALMIFNEKIVDKMDFASGQAKIASRLREIAGDPEYRGTIATGRTALWDAASAALDLLGPSSQNGVVYAITDGGDNLSRIKEPEFRHRLALSGTRLFSALVTVNVENVRKPPEEITGSLNMTGIAFNTGGAILVQ
jgi:hypothetical protein